MWETTDPEGRRVVLALAAWRHIVERYDELAGLRTVVLAAVADPDRHITGRAEGEEWFYHHGLGPSLWVRKSRYTSHPWKGAS